MYGDAVKAKAKTVAQLTSMLHLLERKMGDLEAQDGASTLERDIRILEVKLSSKYYKGRLISLRSIWHQIFDTMTHHR